ncbi:MAG TPA: DNA polymerase III subunit alpha, partial [Anaerolineae bacterium]|nr:DNA polymerase III subunit alpha [Anaerolineae bacterium]
MSEYVELHCHSCFSLLDGASTPEALLDRALELQMPSLALTDHDGLYGIVRFATAARERGLKPICGAEVTLEDGHHLLLLAENREGYGNLCWLISRARLNASKGNARLRPRWLQARTTGLIALTGCRNGWVASSLLAGQRDQAFAALQQLQQLFGAGHLYVELQRHFHPADDALVADLAELANRVGLPIVATNNVHYATRKGHRLHDVLLAIGHNVSLWDARKWLRPNSEYFVKSPSEMETLFSDYPEALENTLRISERCGLELDFRDEALPPLPHESRQTSDSHLGALCYGSMPKLYPSGSEAARRQLAHELQVIRQTKLAGYFLLVWDIVRFARERGIEVRGRGSAANSIVAYLLGITNVDPLAHNLLFERFLSAEARVMPDIDLDFCSQRREEVIQYLYEKYGESHVAMVCNYVTYRKRSAVRDVGKALALPPNTIEQLSKGLRGVGGRGIEEAAGELLASPEGMSGRTWAQFLTLCREIQGIPRHLSIHVGGLCITRVPLDELVPLENATMPGRVVIQWDKDSVEDAGLIKIDILSLRTLSLLDECVGKIQCTRGHTVDLDALPLDDPAVYAALQRADTIGAFQVESRAQQQALVKMKPRCFADIIVEVALIRPGPLQGNMVHPFFQRRMGLEPVHYFHPSLKPILEETLGVIVFQEQVIRVAMVMGQFTAGEADLLRRAMSRHRSSEEMAAFRQRFVAGALAQGVAEEIA